MALTCKEAVHVSLGVLARRAVEAQRLELEDHLGACRNCAQEHADVLAFVRRLDGLGHETLAAAARESTRRAVLAGAAPAVPLVPPRAAWWRGAAVRVSLAAAVAAGVLVLFFGRNLRDGNAPRAFRVVAGDVGVAGAAGGGLTFRAEAGGRVHLPEADVDLARATEFEWRGTLRRLDLHRGDITVDVSHRPGQHFEVRTRAFTVEVLGTRFTVGQSGVHTLRGVVRVMRPDGSVAARLGAGQSWVAEAAAPPSPAAPEEAPAAPPASTSRLGPSGDGSATAVPAAPSPGSELGRRPSSAAAPVGGALRDARRALARGDAPGARRIVAPLFHLGREVGVEARVLYAESFLVEGRYADAVDGYRVVVRDFPETAQAESAAFAIAQLDSEHGRRAEARAALQGYLDRYPRGRFAREAAERLARLPAHQR